MRTLVHIPRPNQGFHVGFAITCAFALSQLDLSSVDILICNDSDNYCPVKTYFDKTPVYGHCAECDSNTDYFLSLITRFNSNNANKINVFYVKDFLDDANKFTSEMAQQELEEFSTRYRNHAKHLHLLNDPIDYTWLSELLSLNQISCQDIVDGNFCHETAIDLIKLSHRTRSIAKTFFTLEIMTNILFITLDTHMHELFGGRCKVYFLFVTALFMKLVCVLIVFSCLLTAHQKPHLRICP